MKEPAWLPVCRKCHGIRCSCHTAPVGERFYRTEWMGVPPDVAAYEHFTRGIRQVMTTPPEYQRREWEHSRHQRRYYKL